MSMQLDAMQQWRDLTPEQRGSGTLPGAQLPARGFYRIKSVTPSRLQMQKREGPLFCNCGIPFWVSSRSADNTSGGFSKSSLEVGMVSQSSDEKAVVVTQDAADEGQRADVAELRTPVDL